MQPENYNRETIRLPEVQNIIRRTELYHEPRYDDLAQRCRCGSGLRYHLL